MRTRILLLILLLASLATAQQKPPAATVRPVTDDYFGTKIEDPYRWMENTKDPEFQSWAKAQATYTDDMLKSLPGREKLLNRIKELDNAGAQTFSFQSFGGHYFYLKTMPGDSNRKLYVRDATSGKETLLFDPEQLTKGIVHYSLDYYSPSLDGKYVAYGVSPGGSEESVLHVIAVDTGKELPDVIDRANFGATTWLADNQSFLYFRLNKLGPNSPGTDKYLRAKTYLHHLGGDPDKDEAVFGQGLASQVSIDDPDFPIAVVPPGSHWVLGIIAHGVRNEITAYCAPLSELNGAKTPWRKLFDVDADITNADVHGDHIYLLSHHNASRYQVLRTNLNNPDLAHAQVVVAAGEPVLRDLKAAADALYVQQLDGGIGRILRVPYDGGEAEQVSLPFEGAVDELFVDQRKPGIVIRYESWTKPRVTLAYDPKAAKLTDLKLTPPPPVDFSQIESREVKARSADGTMVPLSVVFKRGTPLDSSAPTILNGYGSYGITQDPSFNPILLAWLERGGIFAVAHIRGGGEYGEDWHNAGRMLTKQNTISDFIACAEYLIENKYTSPAKLAIRGGSAGGITIGGSITQRPELFAAAADLVPCSDMLREETTPNGPPNIPEFGSVKTEDGFKGLYLMSAYHHIKEKTAYPAVLVVTGINDPRVDSWEAAKMAARLQAATSSGKPVLLRIDYDAGHGFGSTKPQQERLTADTYSFFLWQFGDPEFQPESAASSQKAAK